MAWAHEQVRFLEPAHRTTEVRAIDREHLKRISSLPTYPTRNVCRCPIPGPRERITIRCEPRLVFGKAFDRTEGDPRLIRLSLTKTRENIADHRNSKQRASDHVERHT